MVLLQQAMLGALPHNLCRREGDHYVRLLDDMPVHLHPTRTSQPFRAARHQWISCFDLHASEAKKEKDSFFVF